jgi:acetolactate synthase-1/2/3 large subunit
MDGAHLLLELLKRQGAEVIFGYPGGAVIPIYDALYDRRDLRHVLVRHEQAAAHMADAYYRATGRPGVCLATSGPGATNLVTGLATAYMDSCALVAITGQVKVHLIGNDAFQEADVTGITRPITKHNYLVKKLADLPRMVKEAFFIAGSGRPGPVLIDIPVDLQRQVYHGPLDVEMDLPGYHPCLDPDPAEIAEAAAAINRAARPVFYAGGGCVHSGAHRELRAAAEKAGVPVALTLMALGSLPAHHPLCLGMLGMHGTSYANYAINNCDVLVCLGARFDDRITGRLDKFAVGSRKLHFDIDPISINKNIRADLPVIGDLRRSLRLLLKSLKHPDRQPWDTLIMKLKWGQNLT